MKEFKYDVFQSHAIADKLAVRELDERLKGGWAAGVIG